MDGETSFLLVVEERPVKLKNNMNIYFEEIAIELIIISNRRLAYLILTLKVLAVTIDALGHF